MKKCRNCGLENDAAMNFCLECGAPLTANSFSGAKTEYLPATVATAAASRQSAATVAIPKNKSRKSLWIVGGLVSLLLLVLLGLGGALFLANRLSRENSVVKTPTPAVLPSRKPSPLPQKSAAGIELSNTEDSADSAETPETEPNAAPDPDFTPPTKPTARGIFNVRADENWQLSNLDVVGGEKFVLLAEGETNMRGIGKGIPPEGVVHKKYQARRIFPEFPAGALLMRTRYADGKYSDISAVKDERATGMWQNAPDERGKLEFCVNDNAPDGNEGEFVITLIAVE